MRASHLFVAAMCLCVTGLASAAEAAGKTTLDNLQAAFNGESNANAKYTAFAAKADEEGYKSVAALFRAAAMAEGIHAKKHAANIKKLGAEPKADIGKPDVKSTKENLEAAIKGETYERDVMYPEFIKQAKAVRNTAALRTFNLAKTAEAEHAKIYTANLTDLPKLKGTKSKQYFVCSVCGFTVTNIDFSKCPSCFEPKEKYNAVS
jgi:rubrerythrin